LETNTNKSVFSDLKDDLIEYVELRSDLTKLTAYEIISKAGVSLISAMALLIFAFFFLFFLFLSLGFYFGKILNSLYQGFGIIAFFYLMLLLIYLMIRKKFIEKPLMNKIIESLTDNHEQ
jgi:ABC-type multidrug transport system permease subunit